MYMSEKKKRYQKQLDRCCKATISPGLRRQMKEERDDKRQDFRYTLIGRGEANSEGVYVEYYSITPARYMP